MIQVGDRVVIVKDKHPSRYPVIGKRGRVRTQQGIGTDHPMFDVDLDEPLPDRRRTLWFYQSEIEKEMDF